MASAALDDDDDPDATADERIVLEAHRRFDRCVERESKARENGRRDKRFANADAYNMHQWDEGTLADRGDRPCLTINKVRQHNLQICNDQRQHKTQIKVVPTGGGATYEAAQVFSACIRRIEAQSKAVDAYSTAGFDQVETGLGFCRVVTDWESETSFNKEIFVRREPEPRSIYLDPDAKDYDKADMRFAFKFRDMPRDEFRIEHGDDSECASPPLDNRDSWDGKDHVRVVEYFRRLDRKDHLHLMADGSVVQEGKQPSGWKKAHKHLIQRSRPVPRSEVEWFLIGGYKILDRKNFPCRYIPIVPWIGEEWDDDGQLDRRGHTRALLDPQRMYNYASSASAEYIGLQTKTPYVAAVASIEGHQGHWERANTENLAVLPYNAFDDMGRPLAKPERERPPVSAPAYLELMNTSRQEMMMVSGQYQENFGQQSNAHSGIAINARQREGDNATYHYIDNHAKAVRQVGRILQDMIPRVYDVARVIKVMALDETQSDVHVDPNAKDAHQHMMMGHNGGPSMPIDPDQARQMDNDPAAPDVRVIFNPTVGLYDVEVDVGPSFATQRQEAANAMTQVLQAYPPMAPWSLDILAKAWDWPGADVLAERAKRMIPPQALGGPPPEMEQLQQRIQQVTQHGSDIAGQADQHIAALTAQVATLEAKIKDKDGHTATADYDAETRRLQAVTTADPDSGKVLVRSMLSGLLGMPALPIIQAHNAEDALHGQALDAGPPGAMGGPMGFPDPAQTPTPAAPGATDGPGPQAGAE